jgi:hypothetical protein
MLNILQRLWSRYTPTPKRTSRRTRLGLERLEARDVPATFIWSLNMPEATGIWDNPGNWFSPDGGVGVPGAGDDVIFDGTFANSNVALLGARTVNSLTSVNGYSGTVNLDGSDFTITNGGSWNSGNLGPGLLHLAGGFLNWDGGNFNDTSSPGLIELAFGAHLIVGATNATLGSSLLVSNGGVIAFTQSVQLIELVNNATFTNFGAIYVNNGRIDAGLVPGGLDPNWTTFTNFGTFTLGSGANSGVALYHVGILNASPNAVIDVQADSLVLVFGKITTPDNPASIYQQAGTTILRVGANLDTADYGYRQDAGLFWVPGDESGANQATTATITGLRRLQPLAPWPVFWVLGGTLKLGSDAPNGTHRTTFKVDMEAGFADMTLDFGINVPNNKQDELWVQKTLRFLGNVVAKLNTNSYQGQVVPAQDWNYVIKAGDGFIGNFDTLLPAGYSMQYDAMNKGWYLKT